MKVYYLGSNVYEITLPKTGCPSHLGFEIYESNELIDFTYEYTYYDRTIYREGYTPKYKIVAYDRQLFHSRESDDRNETSSVSLKMMNLKSILNK